MMLDQPIDEVALIYLDVETTGLSPERGDRVVEIGALRTLGPDIQDAMQQLVNPQRTIGAGAYAVHGISDADVADAPAFGEIASRLTALLDEAVFIGHNAPFDLGFIANEYAIARHEMPTRVALDTLRLARKVYRLPRYSLGNLADSLGVAVDGRAHRAMVDVLMTRGVFLRIVEDVWDQGITTLGDLVELQGGPIRVAAPEPIEAPPLVAQAMTQDRMLWIRYRAESGAISERFIRPLGVIQRNGNPLLLAYCYAREAKRTFRLDRVLEMDLVDELS